MPARNEAAQPKNAIQGLGHARIVLDHEDRSALGYRHRHLPAPGRNRHCLMTHSRIDLPCACRWQQLDRGEGAYWTKGQAGVDAGSVEPQVRAVTRRGTVTGRRTAT